MKHCAVLFATLIAFFLCACAEGKVQARTIPVETRDRDSGQLLEQLAPASADPCAALGDEKEDTANAAYWLFQRAGEEVASALNSPMLESSSPKERAADALKKIEQKSAATNAAWPDENRFHFEVLDLPPTVVVKLTIRTHSSYTAFGIPAGNSKEPNRQWQEIGSGGESLGHEMLPTSLDLYPLQQSPSGKARFLARFGYVGCAGNTFGVQYDVREWDPKNSNYLEQIVKQEGVFGIDSDPHGGGPTAKDPFAPVGVLNTAGAKLTLPYCWGSPLDTWDNPSLCAVDTYDLSGNEVQFVRRRYNRPDLVPVAKVIEHAKKHDYPEVLAYCVSATVASKIMRELWGGYGFDAQLETVRLDAGKERVRVAYSGEPGFVVEKRGDRWLVVSYSSK